MDVFSAIENGSAAAVACPAAGDTTIATIANTGRRLLCFHFDVVTQALDAFKVYGQAHASAQLVEFTPASWLALDAGGRFRRTNGDLAVVAAAGNGYFEMEIDGLVSIVVKASGAVNNASVTPRWSLQ